MSIFVRIHNLRTQIEKQMRNIYNAQICRLHIITCGAITTDKDHFLSYTQMYKYIIAPTCARLSCTFNEYARILC